MTGTITPPVPRRTGVASSPRRPTGQISRRQAVLWSTGALCVIVGAIGALALVRAGDQRDRVLIVTANLPAGARIGDGDIGVAEVASDDLALVPEDQRAAVVGSYTKVRILAGQPVALNLVQADPLVTDGKVVVAIPVTAVQLPAGLREQSRVQIVVTSTSNPGGATAPAAPVVAEGVVVQYPSFDGSNDQAALSVEVDPAAAAALVAAGRNIAVILVNPAGGGG